jgi:hypothetical protein
VLGQKLIHFEHVCGVSVEQNAQYIITNNCAPVLWILQPILPDVCPKQLHYLQIATNSSRIWWCCIYVIQQLMIQEKSIVSEIL